MLDIEANQPGPPINLPQVVYPNLQHSIMFIATLSEKNRIDTSANKTINNDIAESIRRSFACYQKEGNTANNQLTNLEIVLK